jgi:hypothetical protein
MITRDEIELMLDTLIDGAVQYHRTGAQAMAVDALIDEARSGGSDFAWKRIVWERDRLLAAIYPNPSPSSDLTVRIDADGNAHLRATDGETVVGITVPRERRREIADDDERVARLEVVARKANDLLSISGGIYDDSYWTAMDDLSAALTSLDELDPA